MAERQPGPPLPRPGDVVRYAYLWAREADAGAEEGRKDRPCAVVLAITGAGGAAQVVVVPVTSHPPTQPDDAVAVPAGTRQRLGLQDAPCWIVVTEVNRFAWPGPDLRPVAAPTGSSWTYGLLPAQLFKSVREAVVQRAERGRLKSVQRSE